MFPNFDSVSSYLVSPGSLHRDVKRDSSAVICTRLSPFRAAQVGAELKMDPDAPRGPCQLLLLPPQGSHELCSWGLDPPGATIRGCSPITAMGPAPRGSSPARHPPLPLLAHPQPQPQPGEDAVLGAQHPSRRGCGDGGCGAAAAERPPSPSIWAASFLPPHHQSASSITFLLINF